MRIRTAPGVFTDIRTLASNSIYHTIDPDLATDGTGNTRFVWASVGRDRILSRVLTANGTFDAVQRVAASGDAVLPKVGIDAAGDALFVWTAGADGTVYVPHYIRSRVRSSDGVLSSTQRLSPSPSTGDGATWPRLAVAPNGAAAVVFRFRDVWHGPTRVFGRVRSASGVWGEVEALSAETQQAELAQVAIDHAGNVVYAWQRDGYLEARARSASGALGPVQRIIGNAQRQHLVVDHAGTAVFAWLRSDGTNLRAQTRARSGP